MNTSFKANAAQHKAFIASVKKGFFFTKLSHLKLELASFWTEKYDWAINDVITFYTATGKYFVVKASDLLVSVDEANNATEPYPLSREEILAELKSAEIYQLQEETGYSRQEVIDLLDKAPARNSIGSLTEEHNYLPPKGYHSAYSSEENQFVHWEKDDSSDEMNGDDWQPTYLDYPSEDIPDDLSIQSQDLVDSPNDACDTDNNLDDECDSHWDYLKKANENWWQDDTFCYSDAIINTCENLAKAILDKCSTNNLPIPTSIDEVNSFVDSTSIESFQATMIYPYWTVYTIDNVQHKVFTCSNTEECLIGIIQSVAKDSSVDNDNSLDDDSHLFYADNTVLVNDDDTEESFKTDWLTNRQHENALQAAKILFHYWALSGNSLPLPNDWSSLCKFVESIGAIADPSREDVIYTTNLFVDNKVFILFENTNDDEGLFFQTLENQAVNYGVHSWFTQKDISVYQQNYQAIVADCEQIIHFHDELNFLADCGEREYMPFPTNINELHDVVKATYGIAEADSVVNSIKDEQFLFFQVLSTMNFINSTASTVEA